MKDAQPIQLNLADLDNMSAVIDIACSRGAFRATEMKEVGELYLKLKSFIDSTRQRDQSQPADADSTASNISESTIPTQGE